MPRRARLLLEVNEEEEIPSEAAGNNKWSEYSTRESGLSEDIKSFTNFGSVRLDNDNTPRIEGFYSEEKKYGKAFGEKAETDAGYESSNWLGLLVEEENQNYDKYSAFSTSKSSRNVQNTKSFIAENHLKSSDLGIRDEHVTIPVDFSNQEASNQHKPDENDLNYFDNLYFKESFEKYDSQKANLSREVTVDPSVMIMREQTADEDLNFVDRNYFVPPSPLSSDTLTGSDGLNIHHSADLEDLNNIDDQYFNVSADPVPGNYSSTEWKALNKESTEVDVIEALSALDSEEDIKKTKKKKKKKEQARLSTEGTALEYVRELRKEKEISTTKVDPGDMIGKSLQDRFLAAASNLQSRQVRRPGVDEDDEETEAVQTVNNIKKYKPPDLENYTRQEIRDLLFSKILYDNHDIVAMWKPYGLPMFLSNSGNRVTKQKKIRYSLECFKDDLAMKVGAETLHEVHRLDSTTTGVVLYAKTKDMELQLRKLFAEREIQKTYLAICNGTPAAECGVIDIPVSETKIQNKMRMTLRPDYSSSKIITNKKNVGKTSEPAVTDYKVLATSGNASFVQTEMVTGRKHQIRLHLGLGLGTPILGDNKYSYPDKVGKPQKVMGDIVSSLNIRQSKARHLPIFLHARRVVVPGILPNGRNLVITANLPHFFSKTLKKLNLKSKRF